MRIELGIPMTISEIAKSTDGVIYGDNKRIITHITTDSREVRKNDLFVALKGERFDGECYLPEAILNGAVIMSSRFKDNGIFVSDTKKALLCLASYYLTKLPHIKYKVAITGSVGKTTTKEFLKSILREKYVTCASEGNHNNEIGMPLSVLKAVKNTEAMVCELGMNHEGEISRMSKAFSPNVAIITNIGTSHIGNLGSRKNIAKAKLEVLDGMNDGALLVPINEPLLTENGCATTFGIENCGADFSIKKAGDGRVAVYQNERMILAQNFAFPDEHLLYCLAAAVSAAMLCGVGEEYLKRGILNISDKNLRQNIIKKENIYFYNDCYNASMESIFAACKSVTRLSSHTGRSAVLGEVMELGEHSQEIHRSIGKRLSEFGFDNIYLFGALTRYMRDGAVQSGVKPEKIFFNPDLTRPDITAAQIKANSKSGELILLKASRAVKLERILDFFN